MRRKAASYQSCKVKAFPFGPVRRYNWLTAQWGCWAAKGDREGRACQPSAFSREVLCTVGKGDKKGGIKS